MTDTQNNCENQEGNNPNTNNIANDENNLLLQENITQIHHSYSTIVERTNEETLEESITNNTYTENGI